MYAVWDCSETSEYKFKYIFWVTDKTHDNTAEFWMQMTCIHAGYFGHALLI